MIAVCGATGTIGTQVTAALLREGAEVRALVRSPRIEDKPGIGFVAVDLAEKDQLRAALAGVERLFLLCPNGERQEAMERNVVQCCAEQGVRRIVKLSAMGADAQAPIAFARVHGRVEDLIRDSGCEWNFIRPNMFMQNLFWYRSALAEGSLPLPLGEAAVSHVDGSDVAAVAARVLVEDGHSGEVYTVTGPAALTGGQVATALSEILGRAIAYQPVSSDSFRSYLKGSGEADYVADAEVELFDYWRRGHGSEVTDAVSVVTRRAPISLSEFALRERIRLA